jgi:putative glutamine amidotransferase
MPNPASEGPRKPRIGVPYRTEKEEIASYRAPYDLYVAAVRQAGGEPVEISLQLPTSEIARMAASLDALVLPGAPADVDPASYGAQRHRLCADPDAARERADHTLLEHAFAEEKPVLAICYGNQSLNVFLGGSLIQDIASELCGSIRHEWVGRKEGTPEPYHSATLEPDSGIFRLAGRSEVRVNSSHHQSILEPGRNLRVAARAPDGVIEAIEWVGDGNVVTGVQWHPERMVETDALARSLFEALVAAARTVSVEARDSGSR